MSEMRELINHIKEADIFKPASKSEIKKRKDDQRQAAYKKIGRDTDVCPSCGKDLRLVGVYIPQQKRGNQVADYNEKMKRWEWGEFQEEDSDSEDNFLCGECGEEVIPGTDFDENEDLVG